MATGTRFLCRLIGLYCLTAALAMVLHRETTLQTVTALLHDAPLQFITGILLVLGGLAWVLVHNRWSGGAPAVVVTVLGWATLLKGLVLLLMPAGAQGFYLGTLHYGQMFYFYAGIAAAIGLYLCYEGFRSTAGAH